MRNSRLFSLPPPLPRPSGTLTASQRFDSESATLPYPTQAAIETTPSSLARGDWGLKRSLPLKSTARTSTPVIRINGDVDSINHIVDFDSAADHALNLKKWQEIGLPASKAETPRKTMARPVTRTGQELPIPHRSVFEDLDDNTEAGDDVVARGRWKYEGPWLAGQSQGEFNHYTEENIRKWKGEFREFLRERLVQKVTGARRRAALDSGEITPARPAKISDAELEVYLKNLRRDDTALFPLIEEFLDLPSAQRGSEVWNADGSADGPPATHPSAGVSYLRSSAHTPNHPVLGPQREERPIRGRVLVAQAPGRATALVGVGGIVSEDSRMRLFKTYEKVGMHEFDPDVPGGAKISVHPERMSIDSQGRIKLESKRADEKTISLYEEPDETPQELTPDVQAKGQIYIPPLDQFQKPAAQRPAGYGLESVSPGSRASRPAKLGSSEITGFLDIMDRPRP